MKHNLTVYRLEADRIDVTAMRGPKAVVLGGWVTVSGTNGEVDLTWTVLSTKAPALGDIVEVTLEADA